MSRCRSAVRARREGLPARVIASFNTALPIFEARLLQFSRRHFRLSECLPSRHQAFFFMPRFSDAFMEKLVTEQECLSTIFLLLFRLFMPSQIAIRRLFSAMPPRPQLSRLTACLPASS